MLEKEGGQEQLRNVFKYHAKFNRRELLEANPGRVGSGRITGSGDGEGCGVLTSHCGNGHHHGEKSPEKRMGELPAPKSG